MKTMFLKSVLSCIFSLLLTGCGLSIYEDWKASGGKAITGGGAIAGKDYVNGLLPNAESRKYFAKLSANSNQPIETVSRTDDNPSKSGVRFVKNGGIVIPSGVTISFTNEGYCMDPHLPAPVANEEYQLVPVSMLIPEDLQGTYKKLVRKASSGDENVKRNMQHLVWALRTAGTDAPYANNLTAEQKLILNRCSEYSGQFEEFNANAKANSKMLKELIGLADSFLNVKIGGVTYKASDLLDPDIGNKKINEHLNQLISMGKSLPVERSGFNYGELKKGVYTDIRGDGYLSFHAKIANSTDQSYIFYPTDYVGQVGSGTKSQGLTFFAMGNTTMRQRITQTVPQQIQVIEQKEPETKTATPSQITDVGLEKLNNVFGNYTKEMLGFEVCFLTKDMIEIDPTRLDGDAALGGWDSGTNKLVIRSDKKLADAINNRDPFAYSTLIHEMTHGIHLNYLDSTTYISLKDCLDADKRYLAEGFAMLGEGKYAGKKGWNWQGGRKEDKYGNTYLTYISQYAERGINKANKAKDERGINKADKAKYEETAERWKNLKKKVDKMNAWYIPFSSDKAIESLGNQIDEAINNLTFQEICDVLKRDKVQK